MLGLDGISDFNALHSVSLSGEIIRILLQARVFEDASISALACMRHRPMRLLRAGVKRKLRTCELHFAHNGAHTMRWADSAG